MDAHHKIIKDNARSLLKTIATKYNCEYSAALFQILKEHPDAPSFFPFSIYYNEWVKRALLCIPLSMRYKICTLPFIAHITTNIDLFIFVTNVSPTNIQITDEKGNIETIEKKDFEHMWDGNILLIDEKQGEIKIPSKINLIPLLRKCAFLFLLSAPFYQLFISFL